MLHGSQVVYAKRVEFKTDQTIIIIVLFNTEMKKFIKLCKAILPRCFRVAYWHFVIAYKMKK